MSTSGKAVSKYWVLLSMPKQGNKWHLHTTHSLPGILTVQTTDNSRSLVNCLAPSQVLEVVGVMKTLSISSLPAAKALFQKCKNEFLHSSGIVFLGIWCGLHSFTLFGCHSSTPSELPHSPKVNSTRQPSTCVKQFFPRLETNCNYPTAHYFALPQHHGLGLPNPFWKQVLMAIKLFLEHDNSNQIKSTLISTSLECTQLQLSKISKDMWQINQEFQILQQELPARLPQARIHWGNKVSSKVLYPTNKRKQRQLDRTPGQAMNQPGQWNGHKLLC